MYFEYQYNYDNLNEMIEKEMRKTREQALKKLSSTFTHPNTQLFFDFTLILAYGFIESHESAYKISDCLNLCKLDFLSIIEDFEEFKEEFLKYYYYEAQNF